MESQKLALIIGNSEYADSTLSRLVAPDVDVQSLAETLRRPEVGGFSEVTALVNQSAATVRRAISGFFANRGRDDLLLLYFSGHGIRDDRGQLFLAAADTEPGLLRGTGIPAAFITEEMDNSRSRRQVLILDCCHSGAFSQGMKGAPGSSVGTGPAFQGTGFGRVVLTATDSTQYAWEGDRVIGQVENAANHPSVFTQFLIQGLQSGSADADGDGKITLDELYDYVYEQVVTVTPRQTPSKWSYGQQGDIVIAHNPHPQVHPTPLPPELQQTIDDPRSWVREGAVRELDRLVRSGAPGLALAAHEALLHLADDDSRRVSSAARESLAAGPAVETGPAENIVEKIPAVERPKAEISATQETGVEKQPVQKPAQADPVSSEAIARRPAAERATAITGSADAVTPALTGGEIVDGTLDILASAFRGTLARKALRVAALWGIGGLIAGLIAVYWQAQTTGLAIGGLVAGLALGLALHQSEPAIRRNQILLIGVVWAICWAAGGSFENSLGKALYQPFGTAMYGAIGWDNASLIGTLVGQLAGALLTGAIGAGSILLVFQQARRPISRQAMRAIVLGWAITWAVPNVVLYMLVEKTELYYSKWVIAVVVIFTLLVGGLGSLLTFRRLERDRR